MNRCVTRTTSGRVTIWLVVLSGLVCSDPAFAQLRPVDPIDWAGFEEARGSVALGGTLLSGQRAAFLGTAGRLVEVGALELTFRVDRLLLHVVASPYQRFTGSDRFAEPAVGVERRDGARVDAGSVVASTTVPLGGSGARTARAQQFALRFGMRLPTHDDAIGLERDETDVFATFGTRRVVGAWDVAGEVGFGIFGVRSPTGGQTDPILYAASIRRDGALLRPYLEWTGHHDTRAQGAPRGNENLSEVRIGVEVGNRWWLDAQAIAGLSTFSPDAGGRVRVGLRF
jgi:hypothetical protein